MREIKEHRLLNYKNEKIFIVDECDKFEKMVYKYNILETCQKALKTNK